MAFNSSSVIIWFIIIRQSKHDSNAVYYFRDPTKLGCFFALSLSLPPRILLISTLGTFSNDDESVDDEG